MEYYSAIKENKIMLFVVSWLDLRIIIPSEVSQTEKDKISYNIAYMWNLKKKKNDTNELIYKTETDSQA